MCRNKTQESVRRLAAGVGVITIKPVQTGPCMGIEHRQGRVFLYQVPQYGNQHCMLEYIGVIAGVEGVAVAEHGFNGNRHKAGPLSPVLMNEVLAGQAWIFA